MKRGVDAKRNGGQAQKQPNPSAPPPIKGDEYSVGSADKGGSKGEVDGSREDRHWTKYAEAISAIVLVFITGCYTYFARKQTQAILDSNEINRSALKDVQRAFISFDGVIADREPYAEPDGSYIWTLYAKVENSGSTPAIDLISSFKAEPTVVEPNDIQFRLPVEDVSTVSTVGAKAAGQIGIVHSAERDLFNMDLRDMKKGHTAVTNREYFWVGLFAGMFSHRARFTLRSFVNGSVNSQ